MTTPVDRPSRRAACLLLLACAAPVARAAEPPDAAALLAAQRQAMQALAALDGHWRGTATVFHPDGSTRQLVQTERAGPMLGGSVKVVEGRGYEPDGSTSFNALAVISYDPATQRYSFRSWAQGRGGEFPFEVLPDGFRWTMRFGDTEIRHTATLKGDEWIEIGERLQPGRPPVRLDELRLRRVAGSGWPAEGAVPWK